MWFANNIFDIILYENNQGSEVNRDNLLMISFIIFLLKNAV